MPQTGQLRKDEPHPVALLASVGQLFDDLAIDFVLGIREVNEISLNHRLRSKLLPGAGSTLPTRWKLVEAAQDKRGSPIGTISLVEPQIGEASQQRRNRNLAFDAGELGTNAVVETTAGVRPFG